VSTSPGLPARLIARAALGVIVVLAIPLVLRDSTPAPNSASRRDAAASFLDAWAASRAGTWKVDATFERTPARGDGKLSSPLEMVQRPPDRLVRQFGSVTGVIDGKEVGCAPAPGGSVKCRAGAPVDYAKEVATELDRLEDYVAGPVPIYSVSRDGPGCFRLDRQIQYLPAGTTPGSASARRRGARETEVVRPGRRRDDGGRRRCGRRGSRGRRSNELNGWGRAGPWGLGLNRAGDRAVPGLAGHPRGRTRPRGASAVKLVACVGGSVTPARTPDDRRGDSPDRPIGRNVLGLERFRPLLVLLVFLVPRR
jgi:hypothetical protein